MLSKVHGFPVHDSGSVEALREAFTSYFADHISPGVDLDQQAQEFFSDVCWYDASTGCESFDGAAARFHPLTEADDVRLYRRHGFFWVTKDYTRTSGGST